MRPEEEFAKFEKEKCWTAVYNQLRIDSLKKHDYSTKDSRRPEFRNRNRYGDVSPYDDTRVHLIRNDIDYINASYVKEESAHRTYILAQGPLPDTSGHFWLMVWEQGTRAVLMLNKLVEKDQVKCHQYYPTGLANGDVDQMIFNDVGLKITFIEEQHANYHHTTRTLLLHDLESSESRQITQFHYTAWPDFGVPESPDAFLDFLFAVRKSGVLNDPNKPPVIHCSAGIGRSGTFSLVDTCLVLIEQQGSTENINILELLMDMRRYRMGLIQTYDQLRFSYTAVIAGSKRISNGVSGDTAPGGTMPGGTALDGADEALVEGEEVSDGSEGENMSINNSNDNDESLYRWIGSYSAEGSEFEEEEEGGGSLSGPPPPLPPKQYRVNPPVIHDQVRHNGDTAHNTGYNLNNSSVKQPTTGSTTTREQQWEQEEGSEEEEGFSDESTQQTLTTNPANSKGHTAAADSATAAESTSNIRDEGKEKHEEEDEEKEIRKRRRDERVKNTAEQIQRMRRRQMESEIQRNRSYAPYAYAGIAVAVAVGSIVLYRTLAA